MHIIKNFNFYSELVALNEALEGKELRNWKKRIKELCDKQGANFEEVCRALNIPMVDKSGLSEDIVKALDSAVTGNWEYDDGIINTESDVTLTGEFLVNGKLIPEITFGKIGGTFYCTFVGNKLNSMERFPVEVTGNFIINSRELTSLVGGPKKVGLDYQVNNSKITNLEGCPDFVGRDFELSENRNLQNLIGAENMNVLGHIEVYDCDLVSLEGAPKVYSPSSDYKTFKCNNNRLKTLLGAPAAGTNSYSIDCSGNTDLFTLEGLPLDKKCKSVTAKKCLMPEASLQDVYSDAVKFKSWTAAYFYLITTEKFQRMSKAQRDPIRDSISPDKLQTKTFALSPIWKDPIMQNPAVKRLMKKVQFTDQQISRTEMKSDLDDLGFD